MPVVALSFRNKMVLVDQHSLLERLPLVVDLAVVVQPLIEVDSFIAEIDQN